MNLRNKGFVFTLGFFAGLGLETALAFTGQMNSVIDPTPTPRPASVATPQLIINQPVRHHHRHRRGQTPTPTVILTPTPTPVANSVQSMPPGFNPLKK